MLGAQRGAAWALNSASAQTNYTAMLRAAWNGHVEVVRLLLDRGANKDATDGVRARLAAILSGEV